MNKILVSITMIFVSVSLFAQGTVENNSIETSNNVVKSDISVAGNQFPKIVNHVWGSTELESQPQRIVTLGWSNQDVLLALGFAPVGTARANWGAVNEFGLLPWTYSAYVDLGVKNPNVFDDVDGTDFEAVAQSNPDAIIATYSGMPEDEYKLLSQIAPTIPYLNTAWSSNWKENVRDISDIMGMREEGEKIISESEEAIFKAKSLYPNLDGKKGILLWINPTDLSIYYTYGPTDPRGSYLLDLGFAYPDAIMSYFTDDSSFSATLSSDNIEELYDLDFIIIYGDDKSVEALEADPLFSQVPAVKNHHVVALEDGTELTAAINPTVLSIEATVEDFLATIDSVFN